MQIQSNSNILANFFSETWESFPVLFMPTHGKVLQVMPSQATDFNNLIAPMELCVICVIGTEGFGAKYHNL